jgi:hypothetical protein
MSSHLARFHDRGSHPLARVLAPRLRLVLTLATLAYGLTAAHASAYIFWSNYEAGTIGRAHVNGEGAQPNFITVEGHPTGVATAGGYVYWGNWATESIGRARVDGSEVNNDFITAGNLPAGVATAGGYLYWGAANESRSIGRAKLDGSEADPEFITGLPLAPFELSTGEGHLYWTYLAQGPSNRIGSANLDGSEVNPELFESTSELIYSVAAGAHHLYWTSCNEGPIRRLNLQGGELEEAFIAPQPCAWDIAATAGHLYYTDNAYGIGRTNIAGGEVEPEFIPIPEQSWGVAIGSATLTAHASPDAPAGSPVSDLATLAEVEEPGGAITFNLYGPGDSTCSTPLHSAQVPVSSDGSYTSPGFSPAVPGTYRWTASYSDAGNRQLASTGCGADGQSVVIDAPSAGAASPVVLVPVEAAKQCRSRRTETLHWDVARGVRLQSVLVTLNGRTYRVLPGDARQVTVSMVGRGPGRTAVRIVGVARSGQRYSATRVFHPCHHGVLRTRPPRASLTA